MTTQVLNDGSISVLKRAEGSVPPSAGILQRQAWGRVCILLSADIWAVRDTLHEEFPH